MAKIFNVRVTFRLQAEDKQDANKLHDELFATLAEMLHNSDFENGLVLSAASSSAVYISEAEE